jgi:hypothetical protein
MRAWILLIVPAALLPASFAPAPLPRVARTRSRAFGRRTASSLTTHSVALDAAKSRSYFSLSPTMTMEVVATGRASPSKEEWVLTHTPCIASKSALPTSALRGTFSWKP